MPVQPWIKGAHKRGTPDPQPGPSAFDRRAAQERQAAEAVAALIPVAAPEPIVEATPPQDLQWNPSDKKAYLVEVAHRHSLETSGLTKAEIIELLRSI